MTRGSRLSGMMLAAREFSKKHWGRATMSAATDLSELQLSRWASRGSFLRRGSRLSSTSLGDLRSVSLWVSRWCPTVDGSRVTLTYWYARGASQSKL
jgi:hypothetical protein